VSAATPLFVDTGAFYARADADDNHHDTATRVFEGIRSGEVAYRPLYTSQAVLSELATLLLYKLGHDYAVRALSSIRESESFNVSYPLLKGWACRWTPVLPTRTGRTPLQ
jgi:predicted nucleic acid-binding protein